jgi:hypothetical protein
MALSAAETDAEEVFLLTVCAKQSFQTSGRHTLVPQLARQECLAYSL